MNGRSVLEDVAMAYVHSRQSYDRAASRGDTERADQALSEMQEIERCVTLHETSTSWRAMRGRRERWQE
jgi:hypothetical protein